MTDPVPYTVPKQPGGWKAITLAIIVHIGLLVMLVIGMHWTIEAPAVVQAEIWDIQPREAAPRPEPVRETPPPEREPQPEPAPPEPPPPPPPKVQTPPVKDPDIVLAEEKKRKEEEQRKRRLEVEQEQKRKLEQERKLAEEQKRKEEERKLAEEKKRKEEEQRKLAEEKKRKEEEEKKRKLAEEQQRKLEEEKQRKLAEEKARQEKLAAERRRKEDMERMMAQVGAGGAGTAAQAQGGRSDAGYIARLSSRIKSNTRFIAPPDLGGNPAVEYRVDLLPDGSVKGIRRLQSSNVQGFDEAVERAIRLSAPFPADNTGSVPSSFIFLHRPKDN